MKRPGWELGLAAAGVGLILLSVLTDHWWSGPFMGVEMRVGLHSLTGCVGADCHTYSFDELSKGAKGFSPFHLIATITFLAGLAVALLVAASAALRMTRSDRMLSRLTALACAGLLMLGLATWAFFPGHRLGDALSTSWGLAALAAGVVAAIAGELAGSSAGSAEGPYRLVDLSAGGPAGQVAAAPAAPAPAAAARPGAPATEQRVRDDMRRRVDQAKDTSGPADFRAAVRERHSPSLAKVRPASVDASADALRFVAQRLTITDTGLDVELADGGTVALAWDAVTALFVGQLPPDPPFEKSLFFDLVTATRPVRVMQNTKANYGALPGGAAMTSQDNFRRLALLIQSRNAAVEIDPTTASFIRERKPPRLFAGIEQFAAYDARYRG